jgi:hypothetical protein
MNAAIERRRKAQQGESSNLEGKQGLFGRRPIIERRQEPHRGVEHRGLGLVVGHALANDRQCGTCRPDRLEATKNLVERSIDRYALQVRELAAPGPEMRVHQDVGLQRTTEPALTLSRTASERRDLSVLLG